MITYMSYSFQCWQLVCFFSKEAIFLLTDKSFHTASDIVPIIVIAYLWNGLYIIPLNFLMLKNKTALIPLVTVPSALINVLLNVVFVPYFGIIAAAWSTFLAFLIQLCIVQIIAMKVYPFPYETRRIVLILITTLFVVTLGLLFNISLWADFAIKIIFFFLAPTTLFFFNFFIEDEKLFVRKHIIRLFSFK